MQTRASMDHDSAQEVDQDVLHAANEIVFGLSESFEEERIEIMHQIQNTFAFNYLNTILCATNWNPSQLSGRIAAPGDRIEITALHSHVVMIDANKRAWDDLFAIQTKSRNYIEDRRRTRQNIHLFNAAVACVNASPRLIAEYIQRRITLYVTLNDVTQKKVRILKRQTVIGMVGFENISVSKSYDVLTMVDTEPSHPTGSYSQLCSEQTSHHLAVELFHQSILNLKMGMEIEVRHAIDGSKIYFVEASFMNFSAMHPPIKCPFCRGVVLIDLVALRQEHLDLIERQISHSGEPTAANAIQPTCSLCCEEATYPVSWPCQKCHQSHTFCYKCVWGVVTKKKEQIPILLDS